MAAPWIKWTIGLAEKRETRLLASRCHRDRHEIAARLMVLWEWLDANLSDDCIDEENGDATIEMGEDWKEQIDDITGLPGFAEALASHGIRWLSARSEGRVTFPNLGRHNGNTAKMRAVEARKKSRQRSPKCPDDTGTKSGPEEKRIDILQREKSAGAEFPTADAVASHGSTQIPPAERPFCDWWWNTMEGAGWVNKDGQPVHPKSWKNLFNATYAAARHNEAQYQARYLSGNKPKPAPRSQLEGIRIV